MPEGKWHARQVILSSVFKDAVQFDFLTIFPVHTAAHLISVYQILNCHVVFNAMMNNLEQGILNARV